MAKGEIVHIEFPAKDVVAAGKFYSGLFGWKTDQWPGMNYVLFEAPAGPGGGFTECDENTKIGEILLHVETDNIEESLAKAESLGGEVVLARTEIPDIGWYAVFKDPSGNKVGLFTPKQG